jgi:hypothetical protein
MGVFNALVAVDSRTTYRECNLVVELDRILKPWMPGHFDWWALGVKDLRFAAILDPTDGWLEKDDIGFDPTSSAPDGYVYVPIRCHF